MPFVIMHFETNELESYDLHLSLDVRHVHFSQKWQAELWCLLRENIKKAFYTDIQSTPEGKDLCIDDINRIMREEYIPPSKRGRNGTLHVNGPPPMFDEMNDYNPAENDPSIKMVKGVKGEDGKYTM